MKKAKDSFKDCLEKKTIVKIPNKTNWWRKLLKKFKKIKNF